MQSVICSLQSAVCSLQSAVCKCQTPLVIWATKNNDLVFEFKGEGCHRTAKSQDNYASVNSSGAHAPPPPPPGH